MDELTELFASIDVCRIASWDQLSIKGMFIRRAKKEDGKEKEGEKLK